MSEVQEMSDSAQAPSRLLVWRLWDLLVKQSVASGDGSLRRQSRLLATFLLVMTAGFGFMDVRGVMTLPDYHVPWYGYAFLLAAFVTNRFISYRLAAATTMAMFPVVLSHGVITDPATFPINSLNFLVLGILLGSIMLSIVDMAVYSFLLVATIALLPVFAPSSVPAFQSVVIPLTLNSMGAMLALVAMHNRDVLEAERRSQLLEKEQRLKTIVDSLNDGVLVQDIRTGRILEVNRKLCEMFGYTRSEVLGLTVEALGSIALPDGGGQPIDWARKAQDIPQVFEWRARQKDGRLIWVEVNIQRSVLGEEDRLLVAMRDVTDRKMALEALRTSELRFRRVWEDSMDGMRIVDDAGTIVQVNDAFCHMMKKSRVDLLGQLFPCVYKHQTWEEIEGALQGYRTRYGSRTLPTHSVADAILWDGSTKTFEVTNTYLDIEGEKPLVLSMFRDATERKKSESVVRTLSQAVEQSKAIIVITNNSGNIEYVNPEFSAVTGYTRDEVLGSNPRILKSGFTPNEEYGRLWSAILSGREWRGEFHNRKKNGEFFWESVSISPIRDTNGIITHFLSVGEDVTERKKVELALAQQRYFIQSLMDNVPENIYFKDQNSRFLAISRSFALLLGLKDPSEIVGKWDFDIFAKEHAQASYDDDQRIMSTGESIVSKEEQVVWPDGSLSWFLTTKMPWRSPDGKILGTFGLSRDITDRKHAEQALRLSEARYHRLVENIPNSAILLFDRELRFILADGPELSILGYSKETMEGKPLHEALPPDLVSQVEPHMRRVFRGDTLTSELSVGSSFYSYTYLPLRNEKEAIVFGMILLQNITGRKIAEEALRESEERFRTTFEQAAVGIAHVSPSGEFIRVNQRLCDILGYTREELLNLTYQGITHPDHLKVDIKDANDLFAGRVENYSKEKRYLRKDGTSVWVNLTVASVRDSAGRPTHSISVIEDISARKSVEEEIHLLNEELEERVIERTAQLQVANKELESFSYSVSHDLRAPLRHISGYVELLKENAGSVLDERSLRYLTTVETSAVRLGNLIDELLAFSRVGRAEMQKVEVNIEEVAKDLQEELGAEEKARKIVWNVHPMPLVQADPQLIRQVMANLMSNAVKFTRGRQESHIEIGCLPAAPHESERVFFIRDNGAGFDMKYAHKLFGVFQRLHSGDEFEGTGIGLANVRRIIHRHGGKTWAEGKPGNGATFYFTLSQ